MATSNYLSGLLLLSAVGVYIGVGSYSIKEYEVSSLPAGRQVSGIKYEDLGWVLGSVIHRTTSSLRINKAATRTSDFRPPTSAILRNRVKSIYDAQIGVVETGYNRGPEVEKYLRYVNVSKGNPWCAAFVCWVLGQAGISNPVSAWSPDLFPKSKVIWSRGKTTPKLWTGDVFGIFFIEKKRIAHAGFIDLQQGDWLITVEGNTNTSGGREGDGVYRKRRPLRSIYRVARYIN